MQERYHKKKLQNHFSLIFMTSYYFGRETTKKIAITEKGSKNMVKCGCPYISEYL